MSEKAKSSDTKADRGQQAVTSRARRDLSITVLLDLVAPLALFYLLVGQGVPTVWAYTLGGVIPAVRTLLTIVVRRRIDIPGLISLSLFVLGAAMASLTGDARLVFAKDGWLTGGFGIWIILSLAMKRPFMLALGRTIATIKVGDAGAEEWEGRWRTRPPFRRAIRVCSVVIGLVLVVDAVVRVVIAYAAPVNAVPTITNIQYFVMLAGLLTWFFAYTKRHGLRA